MSISTSTQAQAPFNDTYLVSGLRFPNTYTNVNAVFDGLFSVAGGMAVTESYLGVAGVSGGVPVQNAFGQNSFLPAWANCGNILEITWKTNSGGFIAGSVAFNSVSGFNLNEIDLATPKKLFKGAVFIVVRNNGVGANYTLDSSVISDPQSVFVGNHPTQANTEAVYLSLTQEQLNSLFQLFNNNLDGAFSTDFFGTDVGFIELAYALGLINFNDFLGSLNRINGLSIGLLISEPLAGDFNDDGLVGIADLAILQANMGNSGSNLQGDINGDNLVNRLDAALFSQQLGRVRNCPAVSAPSPVSPEDSRRNPPPVLKRSLIAKKISLSNEIIDARAAQRQIKNKLRRKKYGVGVLNLLRRRR